MSGMQASVAAGVAVSADAVLHVVTWPDGFVIPLSACGLALDPSVSVKARTVPATARCGRSGCRNRWPADLRLVG